MHGRFELLFRPAFARGFALFTQQDIGQLRKGLELYYKLYSSDAKYDGNYNWFDFHTIRKAQM